MTGFKTGESNVDFRSLDGTMLRGTALVSSHHSDLVLLVHGGGVDRNEYFGLFAKLASALAAINLSSFRFDWRSHGTSAGAPELLTINAVLNDLRAAALFCRSQAPFSAIHLVSASFAGGISLLALPLPATPTRSIVLLNPLLDYRTRLLKGNGYLEDTGLNAEAQHQLHTRGWLPHGDVFRMGIPFVNEILALPPVSGLYHTPIPVRTVHGDLDSMVPYAIAQAHHRYNDASDFIAVSGADHGFCSPDSDDCDDPQTQRLQDAAIAATCAWIQKWRSGLP